MSDISQISLGGVDYNIKDSNARAQINSANTRINTLNNTITNVSSDLTENINKVDTLQTDFNGLQTTVSSLTTEINTVDDKSDKLQTDFNGLQTTVSSLTTEINTVDDKSDKLQTDFNSLQLSVSSISKNLNNKLDLNTTETQVVQGTVEFNAIEAGSITEQGHAILTQDSIYNNLDSDSQVTVLSAGQGKVLNDKSNQLRTDFNGLQVTVSSISNNLNNKLDLNTTSPQTVKGKITFQDEITASKVFSKGNQVLTAVNANVESTTGSTASFTSSISDGIETLTLRLPNFSTGGGGGTILEGLEASVEELNYMQNVTSNVQEQLDDKAPKTHASATRDFGIGNVTNFGHVKLSDDIPKVNPAPAAAGGIAASQKALSTAYYELLNKPKVTYLIDNVTPETSSFDFSLEDSLLNYDFLIISTEGQTKTENNTATFYHPTCGIISISKLEQQSFSIVIFGVRSNQYGCVNSSSSISYVNETTLHYQRKLGDDIPTITIIGVKL